MITRRVVRWLDDRLGFGSLAKSGLNKVFPDHWTFMMGEVALYSFVYLLISGVFLTLFFDPSEAKTTYLGSYDALHGSKVSAAYSSSVALSYDVRLGLLMRQSHHWAALLFIGAIVVHLARIFFTGAFRRPREINWVIGVTLLLLALVNGFAGYSMPDDLLSGTGLRIANGVLLSIPVIGAWASFLVFGSEFPGQHIIPRLYIAHVLIVPALIAALIAAHMAILVRQKHSQFPGPGRTEHNVVGSRLWPGYTVKSIGLMFAVFGACLLLGGLVQINPVWLWGPFEPGSVTGPAQPDWYVGWLDGALRLYPPWEPHLFGYRLPSLFVPTVVLPGLTFLVLYLWPFLERLFTKDRAPHELLERPRDRPLRLALGVAAFTFYGLLLAAFSLDVVTRFTGLSVTALVEVFRVVVFAVPALTGLIAFTLARALLHSEAPRLLEVAWSDVVAEMTPSGGSRRRSEPPAAVAAVTVPEDHLPVDVGPAP